MSVEVITIGDEILIGQVVDTNSAWLGKELNKVGFEIYRITSIRDRKEEIWEAIDRSMERADIVLMTGGLGPTKDDITKKVLCEYFRTTLVRNEIVLNQIKELLSHRNVPLNQANIDQALVPESADIINNRVGTAPIMWFNRDNKVLVALPGVPQEMKLAMSEIVIPRLVQTFSPDVILHRTFIVKNYPESILSELLEEWEAALPSEIKLAYLPQQSLIRLRLTARGKEKIHMESLLEENIKTLYSILKDNIFSADDVSFAQLIGSLLEQKGKTLSTAESCTGGSIACAITANPGSSAYFKGSIVAYSNEVKENLLSVQRETLIKYGAVSEQTAIEMLKGALKSLKTDYAVTTTGIAGPGGGTQEKPVGTVWVAVGNENKIKTHKLMSDRGREANILRSCNSALVLLYELLQEE